MAQQQTSKQAIKTITNTATNAIKQVSQQNQQNKPPATVPAATQAIQTITNTATQAIKQVSQQNQQNQPPATVPAATQAIQTITNQATQAIKQVSKQNQAQNGLGVQEPWFAISSEDNLKSLLMVAKAFLFGIDDEDQDKIINITNKEQAKAFLSQFKAAIELYKENNKLPISTTFITNLEDTYYYCLSKLYTFEKIDTLTAQLSVTNDADKKQDLKKEIAQLKKGLGPINMNNNNQYLSNFSAGNIFNWFNNNNQSKSASAQGGGAQQNTSMTSGLFNRLAASINPKTARKGPLNGILENLKPQQNKKTPMKFTLFYRVLNELITEINNLKSKIPKSNMMSTEDYNKVKDQLKKRIESALKLFSTVPDNVSKNLKTYLKNLLDMLNTLPINKKPTKADVQNLSKQVVGTQQVLLAAQTNVVQTQDQDQEQRQQRLKKQTSRILARQAKRQVDKRTAAREQKQRQALQAAALVEQVQKRAGAPLNRNAPAPAQVQQNNQ